MRLTSDPIEFTDIHDIPGYLLTIDIEKAFDSVDHTFLCSALNIFGCGNNFIRWIKIILNKQESCIMNNGHSSGYFPILSGTRQGDPISAYLFILVMEILLIQVRNNKNIKGITIFGFEFKLLSFADDVSYFLQDLDSVKELQHLLEYSQQYTSLKINYEKSEICRVGSKKGAIRAFSNLSSVNLLNEAVKILSCHYSYNKELAEERNFVKIVTGVQKVLNLWSMRGLSLLGKVQIFKALGISKIQYAASVAYVPKRVIQELERLKKIFLWNSGRVEIKHSTLINEYEDGGIKNVDIEARLKATKLTWVRRLCDDNHHACKIIPINYLALPYGDLSFHRNFISNQSLTLKVKQLPVFYEELVKYWEEISCFQPNCPDLILSESIWFNRFVSVEKKTIMFKDFSKIGINKIGDLYENDGKLIHFDKLSQLGLLSELYFRWMQLIDSLPVKWKALIRYNPSPINQGVSKYTLYLQETPTVITLPLTCKAIYAKLIKQIKTKPTSQLYWEQIIRNADDE